MKLGNGIFALGAFLLGATSPVMAQFGGFSPPKISAPKIPSFTPPKVSTPKLPSFNPPKISTPKTPSFNLKSPSFNPPKLSTPKTPSFNPPKFSTPSIKTPSFNPPKLSTPSIKTPTIKSPSFNPPKLTSPSIKTPTIKAPTFTPPKIAAPKVNIPNPTGIKAPNIFGNSGPSFSGTPSIKKPTPTTTKPPVVNKPTKKDPYPGLTFDYDTATSTKPTQKPPTVSIPVDRKPGIVYPPRVDPGVQIVSDIINVIPHLIPPATDPGFQQQPIFQPQPQVQQQPVFRPQPQQFVQPQPVVSRPAPANQIVARKTFSLNSQSNPVSFDLNTTQAETDARQEVEATEAKRMLDIAMAENLRNMPDTDPNKAQLIKEWEALVSAGSKTEDVQNFLDRFGPPPQGNNSLPAGVVEFGNMRQEFGAYADKLNTGAFSSPEERDQALADLQTSLTTFNGNGITPAFAATLQEKMTSMQNFNTLGKLAIATAELENPYPTLIQGATQCEMPLAFVSEMTGYPVMGVEPITEQGPPSDSAVPAAAITIYNAPANKQTVAYRLGGYDYTMQSGNEQTLDRSYVLSFDNGAGAQKEYTLSSGFYEWRLDPQAGWDIYKIKVNVVIDNSRYEGPFQYLLQGEPQTINPGEIVEFSHDNVIEVAFHSGREGIEHYKRLKPGTYIVGLDPDYGALDLFPAAKVEAFEAKQPPYLASTGDAGNRATKQERVKALLAQLKAPGKKNDQVPAAPKSVSPLGKSRPSPADVEGLLKSLKPAPAKSAESAAAGS